MRNLRRLFTISLAVAGLAAACGSTGGADTDASNGTGTGTGGLAPGKGGSSAKGGGTSTGGATAAGNAGAGAGVVGPGGSGSGATGGTSPAGGASAGGTSSAGTTSAGGASGAGGKCMVQGGGTGGTTTMPTPKPEVCNNGLDDNFDGFIDEGCSCPAGATQNCWAGDPAAEDKGICKHGTQTCISAEGYTGWSTCVGAVYPSSESCDGTLDENCNGAVDEGCGCCAGSTQSCGSSVGACKPGTQSCGTNGAFGPCMGGVGPVPEICDNKIDDNCNGVVDEGCVIQVTLNISGDCVCAPPCPPQAPYPVGCQVTFSGGDSRGCVAIANSQVYFQEGDACGAGMVTGKLFCSSQKGKGLDATNCPINKPMPTYGNKPSDCVSPSGTKGPCWF